MTHSIADDHNNSRQQRTVLLATDNKNSVLAEIVSGKPNPIAYSAYGHQSAQQEVMTHLGFNGELREARIGWYLLGNGYRAYNPRLMRFHSPDSWSPFGRGGLNPYMYCMGDPVNFSDPTGNVRLKKIGANVFNILFGGADITGPSRSKSLMASAPLGPMRPEKTGELTGLTAVGTVVGGAPGPRGTNSPPIQYVETRQKYHPGYVGGAERDGLAYIGNTSNTSPPNPNLQVSPIDPNKRTLWQGDLYEPRREHNQFQGGDATGTHPRDRMAAVANRDRAFVEHRNQMRREALIAAMQVRNAQLLRAGQASRDFREAVVRREAPGMLARINAWLQ